jgi:hypothetical protein
MMTCLSGRTANFFFFVCCRGMAVRIPRTIHDGAVGLVGLFEGFGPLQQQATMNASSVHSAQGQYPAIRHLHSRLLENISIAIWHMAFSGLSLGLLLIKRQMRESTIPTDRSRVRQSQPDEIESVFGGDPILEIGPKQHKPLAPQDGETAYQCERVAQLQHRLPL